MDEKSYQAIIEYKRMLTSLGIRIEKIILFGSQAQKESHSYSDLDLLITSRDFKNMDIWERMCLLGG